MTITGLVKKAHYNAVDKGFYDCPFCGTPDNAHHSAECVDKHLKKLKDKNIGELLMLIVSELGEALEAHRKDKFAPDLKKTAEEGLSLEVKLMTCEVYEIFNLIFEEKIKDTFQDELADAVIRIADLCGYLNIDLEKHIEWKMQYNLMREYKHGKKY